MYTAQGSGTRKQSAFQTVIKMAASVKGNSEPSGRWRDSWLPACLSAWLSVVWLPGCLSVCLSGWWGSWGQQLVRLEMD